MKNKIIHILVYVFFLLALTSCDLFIGGTTLETTSNSTEITSTTTATTTTVITSQATEVTSVETTIESTSETTSTLTTTEVTTDETTTSVVIAEPTQTTLKLTEIYNLIIDKTLFDEEYTSWLQLINNPDINRDIDIRVFINSLQWKYANETTWIDIIDISLLSGESDITIDEVYYNNSNQLIVCFSNSININLGEISIFLEVEFHDFDGTVIDSQTLEYGSSATAPSNPSRVGYTFDTWSAVFDSVSSNLIIIAEYTLNNYTIEFNTFEGPIISDIIVVYDATIILPDDPVFVGYSFQGWFTDSDFTIPFETVTMSSENIRLYAKWEINQYTISFETNGGTPIDSITLEYNETILLLDIPYKEDNIFDDWYLDAELSNIMNLTEMPTNNITIYAKYSPTLTEGVVFEIVDEEIIITDYSGTASYLNVPDTFQGYPITTIGPYAFSNSRFNHVTLGNNIEIIDDHAFDYSRYIEDINIPASVTYIGLFAFGNCQNLINLDFDKDIQLTELSEGAFSYCYSLEKVVLPDSLITIGEIAFYKNTALKRVVLGPSVKYIYKNAFHSNSSLLDINLPSGLIAIYEGAFAYTPIINIVIPSSVQYIGPYVFYMCNNLKIYAQATSKPSNWYYVWNPQNRQVVWGILTYGYDSDLSYVHLSNHSIVILGQYVKSEAKELVIPKMIGFYQVTAIDTKAFQLNDIAEKIVIPNTILDIGINAFDNSIADIYTTFGSEPTQWQSVVWNPSNNTVFWSTELYYKSILTIEPNNGSDITALTITEGDLIPAISQPIKEGYTFLGWYTEAELINQFLLTGMPINDVYLYAKWVRNQSTITFETNEGSLVDSITQEEETEVIAPTEPTKTYFDFVGWYTEPELINEYTFKIMSIDDITLYALWIPSTSVITFNTNGRTVIEDLELNEGTDLIAPSDPITVYYIFEGWYTEPEFTNEYIFTIVPVEDITLYAKWIEPYQVTEDGMTYNVRGDEATLLSFSGSATEIVIPKTLSGGATVTAIGDDAFAWSSIESVFIPNTVISIGKAAFYYIASLETVEFESDSQLEFIGNEAFSLDYNITSFVIPDTVEHIGNDAFSSCSDLKYIVIPISVTYIGENAFNDCKYTTIFIRVSAPVATWDANWNPDDLDVFYGYIEIVDDGDFVYATSTNNKATVIGLSTSNIDTVIVIPNSFGIYVVTDIIKNAFRENTQITSITIPSGVTEIKRSTFDGASNLETVIFASGTQLEVIGRSAFAWCTSLSTIVFPDSLTTIEYEAFYDTTGLSTIIIPLSVITIGESAFIHSGCSYIFVRAASIPAGWHDNWNPDNIIFVLGYTG